MKVTQKHATIFFKIQQPSYAKCDGPQFSNSALYLYNLELTQYKTIN